MTAHQTRKTDWLLVAEYGVTIWLTIILIILALDYVH